MAEPSSPLIAVSINLSEEALSRLDEYRAEQGLSRPALTEALVLHLSTIHKAAPKVMAEVVADARRIQHERNKGKGRRRS